MRMRLPKKTTVNKDRERVLELISRFDTWNDVLSSAPIMGWQVGSFMSGMPKFLASTPDDTPVDEWDFNKVKKEREQLMLNGE